MGSLRKFRRRIKAQLAALENTPATTVVETATPPERAPLPAPAAVPGNLSLGISVGAGAIFLIALVLLAKRRRR